MSKQILIIIFICLGSVLSQAQGTWEFVETEIPGRSEENILFIPFETEGNGILYVATNQGLFKSLDAGDSFVSLDSFTYIPSDISFINENVGFAVGTEDGQPLEYVLKTSDGGDSWDIVYQSDSLYFQTLIALNEEKVIVSGSNRGGSDSKAVVIDQGSVSVISLFRGFDINSMLLDYSFPTLEIGYAGFAQGVCKTEDGGYTWQRIDVSINDFDFPGFVWSCVEFPSPSRGFIGTAIAVNPQFIEITDGGSSWSLVSGSVDPLAYDIYDLHFVDQTNGYATSAGGCFCILKMAGQVGMNIRILFFSQMRSCSNLKMMTWATFSF